MRVFTNPMILKLRRSGILPKVHQTGDTIVEVMVSMTILALVLGVAFATSRHSFQDGLDSSYRDQAQAYAEQQAELIKQLDSSGSLNTSYQSSTGFCIDPTTQAAVPLVNGSCPLPVGSSGSSSSQYTLLDKYDGSRMKYTVLVQWPSSNTNVPNSVTLQYKPQNSFVTTPGSFNPPVSTITTPLSGGWPSLTTDWSGAGGPSAPTVPYATSLHLSWSTVPTAQSCSGSTTAPNLDAGWNGSKVVSGSYATPALISSVTYNLSCNPFGGGSAQTSSVTITVNTAPAPTVTITPTSQTINSSGTASFSWSSSAYTTGCTASGSWSGAEATSGSYTTPALSGPATYTYSIYCTGPGGNSSTVSATVTVNGPPIAYISTSPSSVGNGGSSTITWSSSNATSCTATGNWSGTKATSGSAGTGGLGGPATYTYYLTCSGPGGTSPRVGASVTANAPPPPTCSPPGAGGYDSGNSMYISGGTSNCDSYNDTIIGWNGGFSGRGPLAKGCHTQYGIKSGSTVTSSSWCG